MKISRIISIIIGVIVANYSIWVLLDEQELRNKLITSILFTFLFIVCFIIYIKIIDKIQKKN